MRRSRERRIVAAALRCYPARWLTRHGEDATLLATELLDDGTPWWSIVGSFLGGAAKARALKKPSLRVGSALAVIATGAAVPLALFASLTPASASSANVTITITKPGDAARQLEAAAAAHHLKIAVAERRVAANLVGSIVSVTTTGTIRQLHGQCSAGGPDCVYGLVLPPHYSGSARVTVGVATTSVVPRHR